LSNFLIGTHSFTNGSVTDTIVRSTGDVVTGTVPRTIEGLDKVENHFKEEAANSKAVMDYKDKVKMRE
jgi:hypothetical protein